MTAAEQPPIVTRVHPGEQGDTLEIEINRPDVHNCVNGAAAGLLLAAWRRFQSDDRLLVAVLHGAGDKAFCSGADLSALDQLATLGDHVESSAELRDRGAGPMGGTRIVQVKPVITVSQGYTYAGGLELFCHGHIRIAEPQASFSVACRRWGVPLVDGGTVYLPRLLGWGAALPLIITGERISAVRAQQIGLLWEIAPPGAGLARALDIARQICLQPRDAMLADLNSAIRGLHLPLEDALEIEAGNLFPVMLSKSTQAGLARFASGERFWFK